METSSYYPAALGLVAVLFVLWKNFAGVIKRRRYPPSGPLSLPVVGHLYLLKQPVHQVLANISSRYGPILLLRFGSCPVLLISSSELAHDCLATDVDNVFGNRPPLLMFKYFGYKNNTLGSAPYGPLWRNLRRIAALEILSSSRITALSGVRSSELRSTLRRLFKESPSVVDMRSMLSELTLNTTMKMISGKSYHGDNRTASAEEGEYFVKIIHDFFQVSGTSSLDDFVPLVKWLGVSGLERRMKTISKELDKIFQVMVDKRRREIEDGRDDAGEKSKERKTIIDVMLELQRMEPHYYTDEIIKGMIENLLLGGTETTAGIVEWAMALLLNHPIILNKVVYEIDMQVGNARLLTDADLPNLDYLQNIIKETLRLFPPAPILPPHFSSNDCSVGSYDIPRGTMLLVNIYAIHRDPKVFTDPMEFKPERFEGVGGDGNKIIPFGIGKRRCPGENLAMRNMVLTLGNLVHCFEWERVGEEKVDMDEGHGLSMPMAKPLEAKCKPRQAMLDVLSHI